MPKRLVPTSIPNTVCVTVSDMNVRSSREPYCDEVIESVTNMTENTIPAIENHRTTD